MNDELAKGSNQQARSELTPNDAAVLTPPACHAVGGIPAQTLDLDGCGHASGASAKPEIFEAVAPILDESGARSLFLTSNAAFTKRVRSAVGPEHGVWQFVPLAPLLLHARAVVHSGAHGTNALVLEAGLPSVISPCMFDQRWHAQRQQQLGTGSWARHPRHLSTAIHHLLTDRSLAEQAARIGDKLRREDGTSAACDAIEAVL